MCDQSHSEPAFRDLRPRLVRLAYRMLGSFSDAEDVVQDAYVRWLGADRDAVRQPAAFLHTIVTRLCLNELKSARRRRETYIGPWLPEPFVEPEDTGHPDDLTLHLMIALEYLSPLERAAFLLHDVFDLDFDDVARTLDRDTGACRQLASRARRHIRAARPRFPVTREHGMKIAEAFYAASREGEIDRLRSLLSDDVTASTDGGGRVPASIRPLRGIDAVIARHIQLGAEFITAPSTLVQFGIIDGLPGFITIEDGGLRQTTALQVDGDRISAIYVTRNPDKLGTLFGRTNPAPS